MKHAMVGLTCLALALLTSILSSSDAPPDQNFVGTVYDFDYLGNQGWTQALLKTATGQADLAATIKILAKPKTFHPSEKRGMIREHVFKRAMLLASLAHEDARPASSRISASMIPGRSLKSARLAAPLTVAPIASRLHSGQRDSVLRGTPIVIGSLSQLFGSGAGAQNG